MREEILSMCLDEAEKRLSAELLKRLREKGPGVFVSIHEMLGVITEEYWELIEAVKDNSGYRIQNELLDLGVAVLFSIASLLQEQLKCTSA
ncbi:MAG: hypothetical protein RBR16_13510 [Syntrophus sp. (in: bacteria)]|nr:hypothetical protein [Syntrophus sp. (in: bacteria)]